MNQKIFNLISSIASVLLCGILLVCVCLAWYASNKEVQSNGLNGGTSSDECALSIEIYYLEKYENGVYTKSENPIDMTNISVSSPIEGENPLGNTIMKKFGDGITGLLVVADVTLFEHASGNFQLYATTPTKQILMLDQIDETKDIAAQLNTYQNNMLSNVIHLQKATVDFDTHAVAVDSTTQASFIENKQKNNLVALENRITKSELEAEQVSYQKFCFVMDYDDDYVNYLYEQMLTLFGKNANLDTPMLFQSDISFRLSKGSEIE